MSLGLCMCDSCEHEENYIKNYSDNICLKKHDYNKICYIDGLHQKKISNEMKVMETFYN